MQTEHNSGSLILRDALERLMQRDLSALDQEIAAYPDDASVWKVGPGISNSAGTLVLHIEGNLRHFIGNVLGKDGYVRDRDAEFSTRDLSREDLRTRIAAASAAITLLSQLTQAQLKGAYPLPIKNRRVQTIDFLVHLAIHLGYHLGQVDYHRRLLVPGAGAIDAMSLDALGEAP